MPQTEQVPTTFVERHDRFVERYLKKDMQREKSPEEIKRRVGRPPIPESERREKNTITAYVSDEELEIIRAYVGQRSMSEVLRNAILDKAVYVHELKQRRSKKQRL